MGNTPGQLDAPAQGRQRLHLLARGNVLNTIAFQEKGMHGIGLEVGTPAEPRGEASFGPMSDTLQVESPSKEETEERQSHGTKTPNRATNSEEPVPPTQALRGSGGAPGFYTNGDIAPG